ncbi:MAG: hypothetical protein Pars2KO_13890 [Parasphingorhabdus sp.]
MQMLIAVVSVLAMAQPTAVAENSPNAAEQSIVAPVAVKVVEKKPEKITDRKHPDYVRCRTKPVIGSLAKKKRICMTNSQWAAANQESSKRSREMVEDLAVGMNNNGM